MLCVKYGRNFSTSSLFNMFLRTLSLRPSDRRTSSYVNANGDSMDDVQSNILDANSNWELLTPNGFRFYLPGSVGLAWLDVTSTAQIKNKYYECSNEEFEKLSSIRNRSNKWEYTTFNFDIQMCPVLLLKSIAELFPGTMNLATTNLTIITIAQKTNLKSLRWHTDVETEKLAKNFVLAAVDICLMCKTNGYWADFINPFSGRPYFTQRKDSNLYKTDERFRCLGFQIELRNNCRVIACDDSPRSFIGSLYTTAPINMDFLKDLSSDV